MPRIYRNASHVLVWLGSGTDGESETMHPYRGWKCYQVAFRLPPCKARELSKE